MGTLAGCRRFLRRWAVSGAERTGVASGRLAGFAAGGLATAYWLPALASLGYPVPALSRFSAAVRSALALEDRTPDHAGFALTFDDGPDAHGTPAVLERLAEARVRATFFLVGEQVQRNPALVGEIVAAGHAVGVHCQRHRNLLWLTPRQVRNDLDRAGASIEELTGRPLTLYRPPYGILNSSAVRVARAKGWRTVLWSHWGRDWEATATARSITELLCAGVRPGAVGLLHDSDRYGSPECWRNTAAALPLVLDRLAQRELATVLL
jgi:peptidoglycan/xylan/chitin deacetylase (PgdA/CDA1 family)